MRFFWESGCFMDRVSVQHMPSLCITGVEYAIIASETQITLPYGC